MTAPHLPDVKMNLVRAARPVTVPVVSSESCVAGKSASFVRHLVLDVGGTPLAGSFRPGQSFGVLPPGADADGRPHKVRLYSVASPGSGEDGAGCHISTTAKRLIDERRPQRPGDDAGDHRLFLGVCSNYLCDLKPGDRVRICGPSGRRFLLPSDPDAHDYLFVATGTGIAPFRGMLLELLEGPAPCRSTIDLVMGAPYRTDLLYDDLFRSLERAHENFRYRTAISREGGLTGADRHVGGCIDRAADWFSERLAGDRALIYLCGIRGMQYGVFRALARLGVLPGFARVGPRLQSRAPAQWQDHELPGQLRPGSRCLIEVY